MRIAAIYDIHANLSALESVLQEIRHSEVDCIVVGGDVLPGPLPRDGNPGPASNLYHQLSDRGVSGEMGFIARGVRHAVRSPVPCC